MLDLIERYEKRKYEIKNRLEDFKKIKNNDIFYELCFCLLTPQSNAIICDKAVQRLKQADFKNKNINPINLITGVRFHNSKSKYLIELKQKYSKIINELKENNDAKELREFLVKEINGLGLKESSHFLRNIGFRDLAILDRHILKNLNKYNIIKEIPQSLTKNKYFEIEQKFKDFSKKINIPMDELDLLFWSEQTGFVFK